MHCSEFELVKHKLITAQCSNLSRSLCKVSCPSREFTPPPMSWGATCLPTSTLWQRFGVYLISHICIVSVLLRMTSHSSFLFHVQINFYAYVLLSCLWISAALSQLEAGLPINVLRGSRGQLDLSCSRAQDTTDHQVWVSADITRAFLLYTCGISDPVWSNPSTFKIKFTYLFLSLILGQDMRTRVFNNKSLNKIAIKLIPSFCNHLLCSLPDTSN